MYPEHDRHISDFLTCIFCEHRPAPMPFGLTGTHFAVVFEVIGCIMNRDCFLTMSGDAELFSDSENARDAHESPVASCWLEAPTDDGAQFTEWQQMLQRLHGIARSAGDMRHRCELFSSEGGPFYTRQYLQVSWPLRALDDAGTWASRADRLPIFNSRREHCPPRTLQDVPFGRSSRSAAQLEWEAHVVEYVSYIYDATKVHANAKKGTIPPTLVNDIPIYGPRFLPPDYLHLQKRQSVPLIEPVTAYLKPLHIIHPFYYGNLARCPQCHSEDVRWDGWTATGHRELHGIRREEGALGYQLRCKPCEEKHGKHTRGGEKGHFCFATTNSTFWEKWEYWEMPRGIPIFFQRCGVTRELFDFIAELRPSTTSIGLEENIKQLHLLEYHQRELEYLNSYKSRQVSPFKPCALQSFSAPHEMGYEDTSITHDLVTDILLEFDRRTRRAESTEYLQTLSGICLSLDNTFKSAGKASIADTQLARTKLMKGGILSIINEKNEILAWRLCQSQANAEIEEILQGIHRRCIELKVQLPEMVIVDNCCHVRGAVRRALPDVQVALDTYHFLMRYLATIVNGTRNPHRSAVAKDVIDSILMTRAGGGKSAEYWSRDEQEQHLQLMYERWMMKGGVWSAAASKVHADQLAHVKKGCLTRRRQDIRSDGSRIEGSHKGWNSIQRSFASGLEVFVALAHDFVLRRNVRIALSSGTSSFIISTHGSHHLRLVNHVAGLWNSLVEIESGRVGKGTNLKGRPRLLSVSSQETFGLVQSDYSITFSGLLPIKDEDLEEPINLLQRAAKDEFEPAAIMQSMQIDPALLLKPQITHTPIRSSGSSTLRNQPPQATATRVSTATRSIGSCEMGALNAALTATMSASRSSTPMATKPALEVKREYIWQGTAMDLTRELPDKVVDLTLDESALPVFSRAVGTQSTTFAATAGFAMQFPLESHGEHVDRVILDLTRDSDPTDDLEPAVSSIHVASTADVSPDPVRLIMGPSPSPPKRKACSSEQEVEEGLMRKRVRAGEGRVDDGDIIVVSSSTASALSSPQVPGQTSISTFFQPHRNSAGQLRAITASKSASAPSAVAPKTDGDDSTTRDTPSQPLSAALPLPDLPGLSRSQRIFAIYTGIDTRALSISSNHEFYLFMDMRLEEKWASFAMNSRKWVVATAAYNVRLQAMNSSKGLQAITKNPQALLNKLSEIEATIIQRISTSNYLSRNGTDTFWRKHCAAVSLTKSETGVSSADGMARKPRKPQTCGRCRVVKYSGGVGSDANHKKQHCSDGVKPKDTADELPDWPQPLGIFTKGSHFHPIAFLMTIREMYERVVIVGEGGAPEVTMEDEAFAKMLTRRTVITADGRVLFRLYDSLTLSPPMPDLVVEHEGKQCLRVDCLSDSQGSGSGA
ncbi:hypothetical protein EW146_g1687 [Bondarzewia mesenterica]|uniref:Uncharacterized protein n=1 Tax=Bondarzewia mesenterica TaxID=1095465 RepID=A0A4S4M5A4_9AGAM|nr:hypothetical protein EW146_g1687 [Bondarzewia mesenterica]